MLALLALTMIEATRGTARSARAELERARLTAAADAGVALAVQGLAQPAGARRWRPGEQPRRVTFGAAALEIRIEEELAKVPINTLNDQQVEALLAEFGLQGAELEEARDAFLDWRDGDDEARLRGAEAEDYAARGIRPRNGALRTNMELAAIPAIGPELALRMDPFITVFTPANGRFARANASPLARRVMADRVFEEGFAGAPAIQGGLADGETGRADDGVTGRPLRVIVTARGADGSAARRNVVIELTGNPARPFVVRARE